MNQSAEGNPLWVYPRNDPKLAERISKEFKLHPILTQILISRGFTSLDDVHDFLYAKLPDLVDPLLLPDMDKAVSRVIDAVAKQECVLIYGDNDVDGMTGTALLTDFIQSIGGKPLFFISQPGAPRHDLIVEALESAIQNDCKLLITVDCGITAADEIAKFVAKGIDVIITDHHEPTGKIPRCVATLNPKLVGSNYPNRDITGVGVAFKLAHGIVNRMVSGEQITKRKVDLKRFLDLVAMGTISDMAVLTGENRILVRYGLKRLRRTKRIGLAKLICVCGLETGEISTSDVASKIAPRLNSLGRIADPHKGVHLLLVKNAADAAQLALELDLNNIERQKIERTMSTDVEQRLEDAPTIRKEKGIVMYSDKWHPGVIAILSTRICKQYNRPTVMIAIDNELGKGSIRSIPEFPILSALKECSDLLLNYGGHDFAAGVTLAKDNIEAFAKKFKEITARVLSDQDVASKLQLDAEVRFDNLTFDFMESIRLLEPFGNGNPPPVLYCDARQTWPPKVVGKTHLKVYLEQNERMLEGIGFGMASRSRSLRRKNLTISVAFSPQINTFQNKSSIQLVLRDFHVKEQDNATSE